MPGGQPITKGEANDLISQHKILKQTLDKIFDNFYSALPASDVKNFATSKFNGFVFSKELITRFFPPDGDAEYLLIVLGAQVKDDGDIKTGSPTVISAGCKLVKANEYQVLDIQEPANEHPPAIILSELKSPIEGGNLFFYVQ